MGYAAMALRQGRPRKQGVREPSGRPQRTPKAVEELETMLVVLKQPHRLGDRDQRRRWAVGRLILDGKIKHSDPGIGPDELERAADLYAMAYADMRWVMDSKRPFAALSPRRSRVLDPEQEAERAEEIIAKWSMLSRALNDAGERVRKAMEALVLDNPEHEATIAPWVILSAPAGLAALVEFFGLKGR
jgi:hypothetical protein